MEIAYVLVQCDLGYEDAIIKQLMQINQIKEVRGTLGVFDIFAKIQADSREEIEDIISKIRKIPHLRETNTLTAIISQGGR
ncbi:MAG: Lrp/AsnC ligand binding domain-containing protein [Thermoproteota archaeon]